MPERAQLEYPLDAESKNILSEAADEFFPLKSFNSAFNNIICWSTFFESLDGYTAANATVSGAGIALTTAAVNGSVASIAKNPTQQYLSFSQKSGMRSSFLTEDIASVTAYIVAGSPDDECYGFKLTNSTLQGVTRDGATESTIDLLTIVASVLAACCGPPAGRG